MRLWVVFFFFVFLWTSFFNMCIYHLHNRMKYRYWTFKKVNRWMGERHKLNPSGSKGSIYEEWEDKDISSENTSENRRDLAGCWSQLSRWNGAQDSNKTSGFSTCDAAAKTGGINPQQPQMLSYSMKRDLKGEVGGSFTPPLVIQKKRKQHWFFSSTAYACQNYGLKEQNTL